MTTIKLEDITPVAAGGSLDGVGSYFISFLRGEVRLSMLNAQDPSQAHKLFQQAMQSYEQHQCDPQK